MKYYYCFMNYLNYIKTRMHQQLILFEYSWIKNRKCNEWKTEIGRVFVRRLFSKQSYRFFVCLFIRFDFYMTRRTEKSATFVLIHFSFLFFHGQKYSCDQLNPFIIVEEKLVARSQCNEHTITELSYFHVWRHWNIPNTQLYTKMIIQFRHNNNK